MLLNQMLPLPLSALVILYIWIQKVKYIFPVIKILKNFSAFMLSLNMKRIHKAMLKLLLIFIQKIGFFSGPPKCVVEDEG